MANNTTLESRIQQIFTGAAGHIATAVRKELEEVMTHVLGNRSGAGARAATPKGKAAKAQPTAKRKGRGRKPHPNRSYSDADIERVFDLISGKPGLRSEHIKAAIGGDDKAVDKILERLRSAGRVKTAGIKRAMTYAVPGAASSAPAPASKRKATRGAAAKARPRAHKPGRKAKAKIVRRSASKIAAENNKLLSFIKGNSGLRSEDIQKGTGLSKPAVASGLQTLRDQGKLKMTGLRRAATYSAV